MPPTALVHDELYVAHDTGAGHPERPDRLRAVIDRLRQSRLWANLHHLRPEPVDIATVHRVHDRDYLERFRVTCETGLPYMDDMECVVCPMSYQAALLAAGGVTMACDAVLRRDAQNAFCAVRPPGHHAEFSRALGFCFVNNVAVAAEHLIHQRGLDRVAVVDFDVHHGNGTQHTFEARNDVLFISIHEDGRFIFPGTGFAHETGRGPGEGFTLNIPVMPHSGDEDYTHAFKSQILPALDRFEPQFLLLSAGFDAARSDPLAHIDLSIECFAWMTRQLRLAAERLCKGRLVSVLEGGYDLSSLTQAVEAHVNVLCQPTGGDDDMAMKIGM